MTHPRTLPALLQAAAREGDRPLLRAGDAAWTRAEAPAIVARAAARLAALGVIRGDRVALMAANGAPLLENILACGWLGAIAVPINTAARGESLRHLLADSAPALALAESTHHLVLAEAAPALRLHDIDAMPPPPAPIPPADLAPGDTLSILYTSGTTGAAKGVCCPHAQLWWWGVHTAARLGIGRDDVLATTLPLFHTNALNTFFQALVTGARMELLPRFSASGFWPAMRASGATVTYLLGAMVPILLATPDRPDERAHRVRVALAPGVPPVFQAPFTARTGVGLVDGYGSTETNFVIGTTFDRQRPGLMGPVADGFEAAVVDTDDNPLPDGEPGELVLRSHAPFAFATGYWANPAATVAAWRNLWFHTGDRVIRDADGWFRFVDRLKDAIRRRGENISAHEVEQALLAHADVALAAVFPVPSDMGEDEVMVAVVPREAATLDPAALAEHCARQLPSFAVPRYIDVVDSLPATENGKVRKAPLVARGVTGATWDRLGS